MFKDNYLHLGGDEVPFDCWKSNPQISKYMKDQNITNYADLEAEWMQEIIKISESLKFDYVVWEEDFSNGVQDSHIKNNIEM